MVISLKDLYILSTLNHSQKNTSFLVFSLIEKVSAYSILL